MKSTIEKLKEHLLENHNSKPLFAITTNVLTSLEILNEAPYYSLQFIGEDTYIHLTSFWRAIVDSKLSFSSDDDKQKFGNQENFDIGKEYVASFGNKRVIRIEVRKPISDLILQYEDGSYIEIFADSGGYESWIISGKGIQIICLGGGELAIF